MDDLQKKLVNKMGEVIEQALSVYRCQYTQGEDGDALGLIDVLSPPGEETVANGKNEISLLTDDLVDVVWAEFGSRLTAASGELVAETWRQAQREIDDWLREAFEDYSDFPGGGPGGVSDDAVDALNNLKVIFEDLALAALQQAANHQPREE